MIQAFRQPTRFDEFIEWYPENSEVRYELHRGTIVEMPKPKGQHSRIAGNLAFELGTAIRQASLPYFIPKECIVRSADGESGYEPDVIVLDDTAIASEPRWGTSSVIESATSIRLIVEVVSTNWRDDYFIKFGEYEALGVPEYWLVDYAALGGRRFIGNPKQPTLSVCQLVEGEYEMRQFRGSDRIVSSASPNLNLAVEDIF